MSATDELRKLLYERGIEWESGRVYNNSTSWNVGDSRIIARELADGTLLIQRHSRKHLTPEQAIAATLGSDREAELEALAKDLYESAVDFNFKGWMPYYRDRFAALGIEVEQ